VKATPIEEKIKGATHPCLVDARDIPAHKINIQAGTGVSGVSHGVKPILYIS
jgi:hypothetical protein